MRLGLSQTQKCSNQCQRMYVQHSLTLEGCDTKVVNPILSDSGMDTTVAFFIDWTCDKGACSTLFLFLFGNKWTIPIENESSTQNQRTSPRRQIFQQKSPSTPINLNTTTGIMTATARYFKTSI